MRIFRSGKIIGALGQGAGEFTQPNAIVAASTGEIYVVDSPEHAVKTYDQSGVLTGTITDVGPMAGEASLGFPTDLALNEALGELYVSDFQAQHIVVYNLAGGWLRNLEAPANALGDPIFFRPAGLGIAPSGSLLAVDNALGCVAVLSPAGALIDSIGFREGQYWTGDLSLPIDAVSDGLRVYVTSNRAGRVSVFEVAQ